MLTQFSRTELLLGKEAMNRLEGARVAVFGIGGVGGRGRARLRGGGGVRVGRSAATGSKRGQHQDGKEQCDNLFHNDPPILIYLISQ